VICHVLPVFVNDVIFANEWSEAMLWAHRLNNTVETDFYGFPKVKWLHLTTDVDKCVRRSYQIFPGFNVPKIIKIG